MTEAARDICFELNPAFSNTVGFGRILAIGDTPVRRLGVDKARLQHVTHLILTFHGFDVPCEGDEIAPVAIGLKQCDGAVDVA